LSAVVLMCYCVKGGAVLKADASEVSDAKLERFEERLEKLMQKMDRVRNEIRKTKLMIIIGFTALIAFQILLRWIRF
jgi:ribulose 1,5-bisphosphate carboxylase large subunit-like protein